MTNSRIGDDVTATRTPLWSAPAVCRRHVDLQRVSSALCCAPPDAQPAPAPGAACSLASSPDPTVPELRPSPAIAERRHVATAILASRVVVDGSSVPPRTPRRLILETP